MVLPSSLLSFRTRCELMIDFGSWGTWDEPVRWFNIFQDVTIVLRRFGHIQLSDFGMTFDRGNWHICG